jgi:hypothetical protein
VIARRGTCEKMDFIGTDMHSNTSQLHVQTQLLVCMAVKFIARNKTKNYLFDTSKV